MRIFEIIDKSGKIIYLTNERWGHINEEHPEIFLYLNYFEDILKNPTKIKVYECDESISYYYKYFKNRDASAKYLLLIVKYLNGEAFIITAYFVRNIK